MDYKEVLNPQNRYDWIGFYHDKGLDFVYQNRKAIDFESTRIASVYGISQQATVFAQENLSADIKTAQTYAAIAAAPVRSQAKGEEFYQGITLSEAVREDIQQLLR